MTPPAKTAKKSSRSDGFTAEEKAAMKERVREIKAAERGKKAKADGEREVRAKIAEMEEPSRTMAKQIHELVKANAPELVPRTWYGMPAYAKDDKVLCFFRNAGKFKTRYATFGFSDKANLDDGNMWPTDFALTKITAKEEARIRALLKKAVG